MLVTSGVSDSAQIHTHICYSDFDDIISSVAAPDADVITIESSRSHMKLLSAFADLHYPNQIGPGVFDIHSPKTPEIEDIVKCLNMRSAISPFIKYGLTLIVDKNPILA